jgi:hypothetical protein
VDRPEAMQPASRANEHRQVHWIKTSPRAWLDSATATGQRHQRCSVSPRCNLVIPARASSVATGLLLLTVISADDGYATAAVNLMQQISGREISDGHLQRDREITRKFLY